MAVYTLPGGSARLNVSRGGATFTANSSGFIIRKRRKPLLKRTTRVSRQRVNFRNVVSNYRLMTPGQKLSWASKTPQFTRINSLGNTYELLGNQLFQGLNQNRAQASEVINNIAPDAASFPIRNIVSSIFDIDPTDVTVWLNTMVVPVNFTFNFFATWVNNAVQSLSFPNDYKFIKSFPGGSYTQFDFSADYQIVFGQGPTSPPGPPLDWFIQIVLQATYLPSGEKKVLDSYIAHELI